LDEVDLVSAESSQVGDIEDTIISLGVFTVDTTDLYMILVGNLLMELGVLHKLGEVDVDGGSETGTHVGGAGSNVSEVIIVGELGLLLNLVGSGGESTEDLADVGASLHGDDSELILLIDPDKESLVVVVEDTSGLGPVSLKTSGFKIFVTTLEEEMVSDELLLLSLGHGGERVVFTLELTIELVESRHDELLDVLSLLSGDSSTERIISEVSSDTNSSRVDHLVLVGGERRALELVHVHGRDVLVSGLVSVIGFDNSIEEGSESVVRIVRSSVDTDSRISPFAA